jgi:FkbM family methyltransferase
MSDFLKEILISNNIPFENGKIKIPEYIKKIKFDVGIAIEAIHTENWLNHDKDDLLVFGFEALPLCIEETTKYFQQPVSKWTNENYIDLKWLHNNFIIIPIALGNKSKELVDFYVTNSVNVGCSSIYKPSELLKTINIEIDKIIKVPMFTLYDFFELLPLEKIDYIEYIKIDVQGSDLQVIKSGKHFIQDKVVYVTLEPEVGQYIGAEDNTVENMIKYMNSIEFDYINHYNTFDPTFLNRKFKHLADKVYIRQFN